MLKQLRVLVLLLMISLICVSTANSETNYAKAKRIIYAVFPKDTEASAFRVAGCETGYTYTPWSHNPSGASGYFQVLTGNAGRHFNTKTFQEVSYAGPGIFTIQSYVGPLHHQYNKLFLPWYNTRVAYYLSHAGHDWDEWTCQP